MRAYYTVILVLVVAAILVPLVVRWGNRPAKHRDLDTPRLRSALQVLYRRGLDGGFLHVALDDSPQFVRVYKAIRGMGDVVLSCHMPDDTYLAVGLEQTKADLERGRIAHRMARGREVGGLLDLVVECGPGVSRGLVVLEFMLREVMRVDPAKQCVAHLEGLAGPYAHPGFAVSPE